MASEPPVLRPKHNLLGRSILPLIVKLRGEEGEPQEWARLIKDVALADYGEADFKREFQGLTGHPLDDTLAAAGKPQTVEQYRLAVHHAILLANEVGQPRGQQLQAAAAKKRTADEAGIGSAPDQVGDSGLKLYKIE